MEAIQSHYDVGNEFFRLWLDDSLTYSCALWADEAAASDADDDQLAAAQLRKIEHHIGAAKASGARRVLDIGCGWGAVLRRLVTSHEVGHAVGLTLSQAQANWLGQQAIPRTEVRVESWADHAPSQPYDAIISIGAFEHFARPGLSREERVLGYKKFFSHCREMLSPGGQMSLQTMAYSRGEFGHSAIATSFPESDLPRLSEIAEACEQSFSIVQLRNDPLHYARTCRVWAKRIAARRAEVLAVTPAEVVGTYEHMLKAAVRGFSVGVFDLLRIGFRRID